MFFRRSTNVSCVIFYICFLNNVAVRVLNIVPTTPLDDFGISTPDCAPEWSVIQYWHPDWTHKVSQGLTRSHKASQGLTRPHKVSQRLSRFVLVTRVIDIWRIFRPRQVDSCSVVKCSRRREGITQTESETDDEHRGFFLPIYIS